MRRLLLCLLFLCSPVGAVDFVTDLPSCTASDMWEVWLGFESSDTDCTDDLTNAGSTLSKCCCLNGSVYSCKGAPGGSGTAVGLDLGDDGGGDSSAVTELATIRDDYNVVTEPSSDKALIDFGLIPPYRQYDPLRPPAGVGTGGCDENFTGNSASCSSSLAWTNQDSATVTLVLDSAYLVGDTAADELRFRSFSAATNADQTLTAKLWIADAPAANDGCLIGFIDAGTQASPTDLEMLQYVNSVSDQFTFFRDTDVNPNAGATVHGAALATWTIETLRLIPVWMQMRYTDSSRNTETWISWNGRDFNIQVGSAATASADPLFWGYGARDGGTCRFEYVRLRTDANRNLASDD